MSRFLFLYFFLCCFINICQAQDNDATLIQKIEAYFHTLKTVEAKFTQRAPDGNISEGVMHMDKPNHHLKFTYHNPQGHFLLANQDWLISYDPKLEEGSYLDIKSTPAKLLLQPNIKLQESFHIERIWEKKGILHLMIRDPEGQYRIVLLFQQSPFQLKGWEAYDLQGDKTLTLLSGHQFNQPLDPKIFAYKEKFRHE